MKPTHPKPIPCQYLDFRAGDQDLHSYLIVTLPVCVTAMSSSKERRFLILQCEVLLCASMCWNMEKYVIIVVGARRWGGTGKNIVDWSKMCKLLTK